MIARRSVTAALGAGTMLLAGCGQLGASWKGMKAMPARAVDQPTLHRYPPGSAQRTLLAFYGALQRGDSVTAARYLSPAANASPAVVRVELTAAHRFLARAQPPHIVVVARSGERATVFTTIAFRWRAPDGRTEVSYQPQAFDLERSVHQWRLTDNSFLQSMIGFSDLTGPCPTC